MDNVRIPTHEPYHRIRAVSFKGGFLDGIRMEFDDNLNCIIGGRGTGKTTVLEAIRYALNRMPDAGNDKARYQSIDRLLHGNLRNGSVLLEIETRHGVSYTIARGVGEDPLVTNDEGKPVNINVGKDIVFGVDIYSQNQIEDIANDSLFQLKLIDKFITVELDALERQIRETTTALNSNALETLEDRKAIDELAEATRELPDISERIKGFDRTDEGGGGQQIRTAHQNRSLRERESLLLTVTREVFISSISSLEAVGSQLKQRLENSVDFDISASPNREIWQQLQEGTATTLHAVARYIDGAKDVLRATENTLASLETQLRSLHGQQEKQYRELVEKFEEERAKGTERVRLEQRHVELKGKEKKLADKRLQLGEKERQRNLLRAKLSDLRDQRYKLRLRVADDLNRRLLPMVRVRVEQFGNNEEYRLLLSQSMKGSGLRYASIVDRIAERIPPSELASLIQHEDRATLQRELDIDADRATRMIIQLKDKPELFALETVELHDRPILELQDGQDYKDAAVLSTGQKCTTILPILLIESERPLLVDQPEDNLDNAFVFKTIVKSIEEIRGKRQLIFVTHNPNIPVLGDAARVFALRSDGRAASVTGAGSVDDLAQEIITILEGGREAFDARRSRYGRPIPSGKAE